MSVVPSVVAQPIPTLLAVFRLLRVHQWSKNTLLFVALLTAHRFRDPQALWQATLAFLAYCSVASAVYALNDTLDVEHDRKHPYKCSRPLASGALPTWAGPSIAMLLAAVACVIALHLAPRFQVWIALYAGISLAYCFWLKRLLMLDVLALAALYVIRIAAGAAAIGVPLSFWLASFTLFVFFSLALLKRVVELKALPNTTDEIANLPGRAYQLRDLPTLQGFGIAAAMSALVVLVLYLNSPNVRELYTHAARLSLILPVALYLIARIWILAMRGYVHSDPVVFALKDPVTYLGLGAMIGSVLISL